MPSSSSDTSYESETSIESDGDERGLRFLDGAPRGLFGTVSPLDEACDSPLSARGSSFLDDWPRAMSPGRSSEITATASLSTTIAQRNLRLCPPSPSRKHPPSSLSGFDRKQLQRRLLEAPRDLSGPILSAFHMDDRVATTRVPARTDRGKLLYHLEVRRGFAINAPTAVSKSTTRMVRRLPPLLVERQPRVSIVAARNSDGTAVVEHPPPARLPEDMLREMGFNEVADERRREQQVLLERQKRSGRRSGGGSSSSPTRNNSEHLSAYREKVRKSIAMSDTPLPPPSGGGVESAADHASASSVARLFPHIPLQLLPPPLSLSSVCPHKTHCTPPPHLRQVDREARLTQLADELVRIVASTDETDRAPAVVAEVIEATPKPEGTDDRSWGTAVRDPQAEAAARLRQRMEAQQIAPSNVQTCFGAADHLIEICALPDDTAHTHMPRGPADERRQFEELASVPSMMRRKSTLSIPAPAHDVRDDTLLVLSVGVCGTASDASTLPYADAEVNAEWFADVMSHVGGKSILLRGYEATLVNIREAIGSVVSRARRAVVEQRPPKIVLYFSGKGRVTPSGDILFAPHDAVPWLHEEAERFHSTSVNLHELASKMIDLGNFGGASPAVPSSPTVFQSSASFCAPTSQSPRLSPRGNAMSTSFTAAAPDAADFRWNYPIVIFDVVVDRCKEDDRVPPRPMTAAEKADFWRPRAYGGILALQHEGGTLSMSCSARHSGLVVYYVCKTAEGRLSGHNGHIGSISQITQFVADKLRARIIPTMELRCAAIPKDFAQRAAEELFHPASTLFSTSAAKRECKRVRERKQCRWTLTLEVGLEYRYNPTLFVTNLTRRVKEMMQMKQKQRPKNAPPLMLWMGSRRMEHRFYLPLEHDPSTDVFRYDIISAITRSNLSQSGSTGAYYVAASLESIDHTRFDFCKGEHCIVANSQGVSHNRWSYNPFVQGLGGERMESMGGLRSHSDADLDFIYVLAECAAKSQEMEILSFLDGKKSTELITVHGCGSVNDLRRILKFSRFGLLDIGFCNSAHVVRVEVSSLGENEAEEAAALVVQKMIRRHLTSRTMKSRLMAASSFYRQQQQAWVDGFEAYCEELLSWYVDYREEAFAANEAAQKRRRHEIRVEEAKDMSALHTARVSDWILLESRCRRRLYDEFLVDAWSLMRLGDALPQFAAVQLTTRHLSEEEHCLRHETECRQRSICEEFHARFELRRDRDVSWASVLAACAPVRRGKRIKKPKEHYELPLTLLMKY